MLFIITVSTLTINIAFAETGMASYYSGGANEGGSRTANGERYNAKAMTCAHKTKPFGSILTVHFAGKAVQCRVNDRGPFKRGRILDLSLAAAKALGMLTIGVGKVEIY